MRAHRAALCAACPVPCAWQADGAARAHPCHACPRGDWAALADCTPDPGAHLGNQALIEQAVLDPLSPPRDGLAPLRRRVRSYRKAGLLVGLREFLRRRTLCGDCERRKALPTHPGLYGCGKCSACSGGPERMLAEPTICPLGKWQSASGGIYPPRRQLEARQ